MISSAYNSSLSALRAFGMKMSVTADNIANVNTDGFKKSRATIQEGLHNGVRVDISRIDSSGLSGFEWSEGQMKEKELSNVNLSEEIPHAMITRRCYEANLKVLKTEDEILGTLIDIKS